MNTLKNSKTAKYTLAAGALLIASTAIAATFTAMSAPDKFKAVTPTDSFVLDGSAEASTTVNQLEWARCLVGQQFVAGECTGDATEFDTWEKALAAADTKAADGWRVPNIKELVRITDTTQAFPAINTEVFPFALKLQFNQSPNNYGGDWHWSSGTSPFIWSATPVKIQTATVDDGGSILTPEEAIIATEKDRENADQAYAIDLGLGQPEKVYRDGVTNGEHNATAYSNNDPDNVEKARYVLLVRDIT